MLTRSCEGKLCAAGGLAALRNCTVHCACRLHVQLPAAPDQLSRASCCSWQATQAAKEVGGNPYKTLLSRQYRPQLIITILVRLLLLAYVCHNAAQFRTSLWCVSSCVKQR